MKILGISDAITDSGIVYCKDGKLVFAVSEERFTRNKVQGGFPKKSLKFFSQKYKKDINNIDKVIFAGVLTPTLITRIFSKIENIDKYEKKEKKIYSIITDIIEYKLKLTTAIKPENKITKIIKKIAEISLRRKLSKELKNKPIEFIDHHLSHASAAFYSFEFNESLVVSFDGFGDGYSGKIYLFKDNEFENLFEANALDSFGLFYSLVTVFLGYKEHKHEGKITGLAAFGNAKKIKEKFPFKISSNMKLKYTGYLGNKGIKFLEKKLSGYKKEDIAAWLQENTEKYVCEIVSCFIKRTGQKNICLVGGLFSNIKLNQKIHEIKDIENIYIYPAMSDTGISHGAICATLKQKNKLENVFLGPDYSNKEIENVLKKTNLNYKKADNIEKGVAKMISAGKIVARFNGKMEWGPRALGNRSILVQATDKKINKTLNEKLKRTEFMPFAPVILERFVKEYIKDTKGAEFTSKFMNISFPVTEKMKKQCPAAVHVDGTARPQILEKFDNPSYYKVLDEYYKITGIPVIINTSFNFHGEPIVMTPEQAIQSYLKTGLDYLIMGDYIIH